MGAARRAFCVERGLVTTAVPKELESWIAFLETAVRERERPHGIYLRRQAKQLMREVRAAVEPTDTIEHAIQRVVDVCESTGYEIAHNASEHAVSDARQSALMALEDLRKAVANAKPSALMISLGRGW
jgi:hypothetical protein